ncbi:MAG TPA: VWA domain-containing protein [Bryobacteraceae bacterium]|nr:VWA domain-containing protein [Bryobacteraceae bacterium]
MLHFRPVRQSFAPAAGMVFAAIVFAPPAFAQQAAPQMPAAAPSGDSPQTPHAAGEAPHPQFRVDVNLREIDVVVNDPKGKIATDLGPADFQVLENGQERKLTNFSFIEVTPPPTGAVLQALQERPSLLERFTGVPRRVKTPGSDILAAPVANPRKEDIRRTIAFVFHDTSGPIQSRVRKFIDEQVGPGDMVSIRSVQRSLVPGPHGTTLIRDSMGIFQQFSNDKRQLDAATERIQRTCDFLHSCVADSGGALRSAIESLSLVPGRKAVVYVGMYLGPVASLVNMANRAGVAIYVLNTAPGAVAKPPKPDGKLDDSPPVDFGNATDLARLTGGRRILTDPGFDMTSDLNEVMEDLRGYYLLGFHTLATEADAAPKNPGQRSPPRGLQVKILRAGYTVQFRNGTLAAPETAAPPPPPAGREAELENAMFSIYASDGVHVHLDPMFFTSMPDPKTHKRNPVVRALLDIDGRDLTYADRGDGAKRTTLDVAVAVFNADGTQAGAKNQALNISVPRTPVKNPRLSMQYTVDIPVAGAGSYQVRTAVRDAASRRVGSSYAYLDIPDFNKRKLALSSLVLSLSPESPGAADVRPEWKEFEPGASVLFGCEVFGLKTPGKPPEPPRVEVGVRLYRGGAPVVDIPPAAAGIENKNGMELLTGRVQVPGNLPAGNYEMELIAYDRGEPGKKLSAIQWTDVTVKRSEGGD